MTMSMTRVGTSLSGGILDILYNKILILSTKARSQAVLGNLTNLLFTDLYKVSFFISMSSFETV